MRLGLYIRQWDGEDATFLLPQLPDICSFQLSYSITIQQIRPSDSGGREENNIIVIGPKTVMDRTFVYEVVNSSLVVDAVYSVLVEFDTLAGNVSSNTTFGKQMIFENTLKVYEICISFYPIWKQTYLCCTNCHLHKYKLSLQKHFFVVGISFTLDQRPHSQKYGIFVKNHYKHSFILQ